MRPQKIFASLLSFSMLFGIAGFSDCEGAKAVMYDMPQISADMVSDSLSENWSVYERILELVNINRAKNGAAPLKLYYRLCQAAEVRAGEISRSFSHIRPDGSNCFDMLGNYNVSYNAAAENIAAGYDTAEQVVQGWMNSQQHRTSMLSSKYTHMGVGVFEYNGTVYWSQIFTNGTYSDEDVKPQSTVISGDVNNDKKVDSRDASAVLREYAASSSKAGGSFTNEQKKAADINKDSKVDARDASMILVFYAQSSALNGEQSIERFVSRYR